MTGDAASVMMADEADDCRDVVRYWKLLNQGLKLRLNRLANAFIMLMFGIKTQRYDQCLQSLSRHPDTRLSSVAIAAFQFNCRTPLKTIVRGYSWTVMPITWRNRRLGDSKLSIKEMGSRYLLICLYIWLEKYFSRGDYKKQ
jgi:dolichol-phosphate mannosyltransferase